MKYLLCLVLLLSPVAGAMESYNVFSMGVSVTGEPITVVWCVSPEQQSDAWTHEVEIVKFPAKEGDVATYAHQALGTIERWTFSPTRAGLYFARARSCSAGACSDWNVGFKQEQLNICSTEAENFLWYIRLAPATGGTIE